MQIDHSTEYRVRSGCVRINQHNMKVVETKSFADVREKHRLYLFSNPCQLEITAVDMSFGPKCNFCNCLLFFASSGISCNTLSNKKRKTLLFTLFISFLHVSLGAGPPRFQRMRPLFEQHGSLQRLWLCISFFFIFAFQMFSFFRFLGSSPQYISAKAVKRLHVPGCTKSCTRKEVLQASLLGLISDLALPCSLLFFSARSSVLAKTKKGEQVCTSVVMKRAIKTPWLWFAMWRNRYWSTSAHPHITVFFSTGFCKDPQKNNRQRCSARRRTLSATSLRAKGPQTHQEPNLKIGWFFLTYADPYARVRVTFSCVGGVHVSGAVMRHAAVWVAIYVYVEYERRYGSRVFVHIYACGHGRYCSFTPFFPCLVVFLITPHFLNHLWHVLKPDSCFTSYRCTWID